MLRDSPLAFTQSHGDRFLTELIALVRFPTVSAQPQHAPDLMACAHWLANHLAGIGMDHVQVMRTPRHPLVYADWLHAGGEPTVLIYGHYDVQPAEPLDQWTTPPFEPATRGAKLYGRGASDDKGQFFAHIKALESYLCTTGRIPVNVKVLLEGEEEIGSPSLMAFARRNEDWLAADAAVVSDMPIPAPDRPAITIGLRGMLNLEIEVSGPLRDLHSGVFGGAVHNSLQALCEIVASLHDRDGRIAISGFYDQVRLPSAQERIMMARVSPSDVDVLRRARVEQSWGERGFSLFERTTIRPSLSVNGITGGYQGPGPKSVIPAQATAKLSVRLAPDQDPAQVDSLFRQHVARVAPASVRCLVRTTGSARPVVVDPRHPAVHAAAIAYRRGFGREPVYLRSGGTVPVVSILQETLGIAPVLMGFALPEDGMHGPDETFHLPNFYRGIATSAHFLAEMARSTVSREKRMMRSQR